MRGFGIYDYSICSDFSYWRITSSRVKGTAVYGDEYALAENIDMFLYLQPDEWDKLGEDKNMYFLKEEQGGDTDEKVPGKE